MIEVRNLTKRFNGKTVLSGVSFQVKEGEVFGYLGPSQLRLFRLPALSTKH